MDNKHRLLVVGGGFAGLSLIHALRSEDKIEITLIDKRNHHLFQPLLYQIATGGLSPANIATPLRLLYHKHKNCRVLMGEATGIDVAAKILHMNGHDLPYDTLVLAAGATNNYFGNDAWAEHATGLKSLEEATKIRAIVLSAFERAELENDEALRRKLLTFVVIGGGPTGVEMAGAICELAHTTLKGEFSVSDPTSARVLLIEGGDRLLASFEPSSSRRALASLHRMGVEVWLHSRVKQIEAERVVVEREGKIEEITTTSIVWAAGVKGESIGAKLAEATNTKMEKGGRVPVLPDLTIANHANIFVIGDIAAVPMGDGKFVPGLAPAAIQQGRFVAKLLRNRLAGRPTNDSFHYTNKGNMATIGRASAVVEMPFPKIRFGGYFAWLAWLFVHIMYLIQFQSKILIMTQWAWNYFTRNRSALLITHTELLEERRDKGEQQNFKASVEG